MRVFLMVLFARPVVLALNLFIGLNFRTPIFIAVPLSNADKKDYYSVNIAFST